MCVRRDIPADIATGTWVFNLDNARSKVSKMDSAKWSCSELLKGENGDSFKGAWHFYPFVCY
jgi:hypothetical protein